ncbi:hypothetical protein Bca52824_054662 [Brassica carinata]|uniref:BHLH domain-containing protein n=1 Tax=Brassica carinata TaxID=52824 RepID=A0A8X7ULV9_BRACI|nr:hypothetical protein Bca52824_054662 [Brassica carinata]
MSLSNILLDQFPSSPSSSSSLHSSLARSSSFSSFFSFFLAKSGSFLRLNLLFRPWNACLKRNSLKRNIDAQFHNLSEKRRRSKINEKMKSLQKLIPNSNKTDKASMLDEAIEYLKQLQLQVQTLAVMNGLGLNSMRLPPHFGTRLGAPHSMVNREPPQATQEMCFSTGTLL